MRVDTKSHLVEAKPLSHMLIRDNAGNCDPSHIYMNYIIIPVDQKNIKYYKIKCKENQ